MCRQLEACVETPAAAQITVSTVHKAKGLEWPRVLMSSDFNQFVELDAAVMAFAVSRGEPFKSFFEPNLLAQQLQKLGFAELSDLGPDEAAARYFSGRTDGLRPLASEHFMRAGRPAIQVIEHDWGPAI